MKEVLYRGKALMEEGQLNSYGIKHKNGWVEGNLVQNGKSPWIVGDIAEVSWEYIYPQFWVEVDPETVSQYIGIKDIHGNKVHKGHIVKVRQRIYKDCSRKLLLDVSEYIGEVVWHQHGWCIAIKSRHGISYTTLLLWGTRGEEDDTMEIIGDRYNNPEMRMI